MKKKMPFVLATLLILFSIWSGSRTVSGQTGAIPAEAQQVLFLIDNSASMTELAHYPDDAFASRWQLVQKLAPEWLSKIPEGSLVGAVSVGGNCGEAPSISLRTGTDRTQIAEAIRNVAPNGATPLNAVLKTAPSLFAMGVKGTKRIELFSDGLNTCSPNESTCEIVRALHRDYGIVVDVVAWVTEPSMESEFRCVTDSTGGIFSQPGSTKNLARLPFLELDPWRYVVLVLGLITLMLASLVSYRHGYYVMKWSTQTASTIATIVGVAGSFALYLVLFARSGWFGALLGLMVVGASVAIARSRSDQSPGRSFSSGACVLAACLAMLFPSMTKGQTHQCPRAVQGPPRYHHILALDASGTVAASFNEMKALVACYASMYTLPNEEISLVAFGMDSQGSAREITTFTVPQSGSVDSLNRTLDDLEIRNAKQTRTYFKPLADYLSQRLKSVRLEPVILVISDGKSDAPEDARHGRINFREIPFESFGRRGVYAAPAVTGWRVAVEGGASLDLTLLFKHPLPANEKDTRLSGPVPECLVDPDLVFEAGDTVTLKPGFNPFSSTVEGALTLKVKNECVSRFRSFRAELRRGNDIIKIGTVTNMSVNPEPSDLSLPFTLSRSGLESSDAIVQLVLDQGNTERTIYATRPSRVALKEISYLSAYGVFWGVMLAAVLLLVFLGMATVTRKRTHQRHQPQLIGVMGGNAVALGPNQRIEIGGAGSTLQIPGVEDGIVLGSIESTAMKGKLAVLPAEGFRMKVNGFESTGSSEYVLGTPLQFAKDGATYDVTLHSSAGSGGFAAQRPSGKPTDFDFFSDFGHSGGAGGSDHTYI